MDIAAILQQVAISAIPIVIAITFHEVAHGYVAYRLGDPTAKMMGRLTLNPIKHIDPFGTIILPIMILIFTQGQFVFGYAKPVPIGVRNFKDPRRDMAITGAAGPLTNVALALVSAWIFSAFILTRGTVPEAVFMPVTEMLRASVYINVILAALNLLPVPPLDGGRVVAGLLPRDLAYHYERIEPYGMIIVIILLATGLAGTFIMPIARIILSFIALLS
ncbi:MAG: site-2 protease family protein [Thermodesulfovibrionales bacterium]|nr:site-2 protease family protein [Thermodesulfovibrionales bacterium]